jgi:histidine triad (HIT) family protein
MGKMFRLYVWLARSQVGRWWIRRLFTSMSFIIPVKRLRETSTLLAFYHPQPAYPFHVLLVPRQAVASLMDLPPESGDFMRDLLDTVQSLVREFHLEGGYRLIANGGAYQDFPILHFHLVAGDRS